MKLTALGLAEPAGATDPFAVDERRRLAEGLVSFAAPGSLEADQYRTLRHEVERFHRDCNFRVFGVTSPCAGDGKTLTSLNLAGSLAQSAQTRVLIVDADLHRPAVAKYLGLAHAHARGLTDVIVDEGYGLTEAVRRLHSLNISVLLAGKGSGQAAPYELLASSRLDRAIDEARRLFDYVIIDTPPLLPLADCRLLARWVDGFIVVVAADKTTQKLLGEALELLDRSKVLGVVLNGEDRPLSAYNGYSRYYSGHRDTADRFARESTWRRQGRTGLTTHGRR